MLNAFNMFLSRLRYDFIIWRDAVSNGTSHQIKEHTVWNQIQIMFRISRPDSAWRIDIVRQLLWYILYKSGPKHSSFETETSCRTTPRHFTNNGDKLDRKGPTTYRKAISVWAQIPRVRNALTMTLDMFHASEMLAPYHVTSVLANSWDRNQLPLVSRQPSCRWEDWEAFLDLHSHFLEKQNDLVLWKSQLPQLFISFRGIYVGKY